MTVKIVIIMLFICVTVVIGLYARRHTGSVVGFVLGGRNVGPWLSAFAYGTTYFSAVIFVGYAGQFGWKFGLSSTWIGIGNAVLGSLLAWMVLGRRTRRMTHALDAKTMPEFFGKRFDSHSLRIVAALIVFVFLIPYTASVYNGLSRLFEMAFGMPYSVCIIGMAIITCIYVVLGGYMATALNDAFQGVIMLLGIVATIVVVLISNGGLTQAVQSLSLVAADGAATTSGVFTSLIGPDLLSLLSVIILTSFGTWGLPQMVQKFYAIKDDRSIRTGTIISTVFAVVVAGGSYFLGGFGRLYASQISFTASGVPVYDSIIPTMLSTLPDLLIGLVVILVLSASMSTLSSLVLTSSSTLTIDFIDGNLIKDMSQRSQIRWMRGLLIMFVIISAFIALVQYNSSITFIAQLMGISWGALAGAFLAPFLYGLYWKRTTAASVWASFVFAITLTVTNMTWGYLGSSIIAGALAMVGGLVIVPVVSLLTSPQPEAEVERMFACYDAADELATPGETTPSHLTSDAVSKEVG
jgi:SSS family transporter